MSVEIPGYKILRILGRGGMAKVYLAIQEVFEREVALKVMSKALAEDPNFGQRFFREAKIVSKLVHPNIVTVHDVGMHEGYCYLSMEYIDGRDLKHAVHGMEIREKVRAIYDIAKALDYAGGKGYVHRDIKPENIMFHSSDGRAVLMDFGIARAAESDTQVTQAGTAIGTPHYMSPEQAKGKSVDHRSDIYSLGVVFFYILAGHVPYDAESAVAIGIKHITEPIPLLPPIYESLQPLIDKMMAKDVNKRYQNAKELMADLDHIDLDVLEHTVGFAASVVSDHTTVQNMAPQHDDDAEAFELEDDEPTPAIPDYQAYVHDEVAIHDRPPILPWFLASTFVVGVIGVFVYFKNPTLVQPLIDKVLGAPFFEESPLDALVIRKPTTTEAPEKRETDKGEKKGIEQKLPEAIIAEPKDVAPPLPSEDVQPGTSLASGKIHRASGQQKPLPPADLKGVNTSVKAPSTQEQAIAQEKAMKLAGLKTKIARLEDSYAGDDIYLSDLVGAFREAMYIAPKDKALVSQFESLKKKEYKKLYQYADKSGASANLDKRIEQFQALFPEIKPPVISKIVKVGKTRKKVMSLVLEAQAYLRQNNLTKPAGRNALDVYNKVLVLDPKNADAQQGKKQISTKLYDAAKTKYRANKLRSALASVKKAIEVDVDNDKAQKLADEINAILNKQSSIANLLKSAEKKINSGQLFTPRNKGAFHDFQSVLKMDPQNTRAHEGLDRVVDALSAQVWQLVGDEQFLKAKELMRAPLKEYGGNKRIKSLSLALDEVIGEKIIDVEPRVEGMMIQAEPIERLVGRFDDVLDADRSIYLGFRYENFQTSTTVLQAVLMDGAKRVQIAQVPVVVKGAEGESKFRIDRPVEGFPRGSYSIEMRLGRETLNSTLFRVK